jgi:hypothetical protein
LYSIKGPVEFRLFAGKVEVFVATGWHGFAKQLFRKGIIS